MSNVSFNAPTRIAGLSYLKWFLLKISFQTTSVSQEKKKTKKVVEMPRPCQYPKLRNCVSKAFSFDNATGQKKTNLKFCLVPQYL